ncbi:MAG: hypothetical protein KAJ63_00750 [Methyloprofundus sp.]|nr:hypothetical protein [Methyloprofundus sp.]
MDKDLLRVVILAVGAVLILGMIVWGILSNRSKRKKINFYDNKDPLDNIDPKLVMHTEDDDFDIVPISTQENDEYQVTTRVNPDYQQVMHDLVGEPSADKDEILLNPGYSGEDEQDNEDLGLGLDLGLALAQESVAEQVREEITETGAVKKHLPVLLQLSIVAQTGHRFTGTQIKDACERLGLVYGNVQVFERLDLLGRVDYAVASMLDPGTFPEDDWEAYQCSGITFFMQAREVDDAAAVFAEMINTLGQLSALLEGHVLDQDRQPFTEETLHAIEATLK